MMDSAGKKLLLLTLAFSLILVATPFANAQVPRIFITDLPSGPNSGGENVGGFAGAYVTLYGNLFGATQGSSTVTLNGANCLRVVSWGGTWRWYQKIVVQLGSSCASGNFVVTVNGVASNAVPFTVRSGNIYCVSTSGNDSNPGTFSGGCWKSLTQVHGIAAGGILYALNGVTLTAIDNYNAVLWLGDSGSGTAAAPKALIAYPGATVTLGSASSGAYALRGESYHAANNYWIVEGLTLISGAEAVELGSSSTDHWWLIGNDMSCPQGSGEAACVHVELGTNIYVYGNYIHNVGDQHGSIDKYYHGLYFTTNTVHVWAAWNEINNNPTGSTTSGGCRGIQFYSTGGSDQYDLHVHDNYVHNTICDGINFATVNANNGTVEAYNNVIVHVGTGPDPADGSSNYSCFLVGSSGSPTTAVSIYNNSMYDCGSRGSADSGAFAIYGIPAALNNNITQLVSGETYLNPNENSCSTISGSNNDWYGVGSAPCSSQLTGNLNSNPLFVSTATPDLHLQSGSPMIGVGTAALFPVSDHDGVVRSSPPSVGAYEYPGPGIARPNPPTNLTVTVN